MKNFVYEQGSFFRTGCLIVKQVRLATRARRDLTTISDIQTM
jgi:hypothetical protein